MNKIFKKVWNKHRGCFVAVSEAMTSAAQTSRKAAIVGAGLLVLSGIADSAVLNISDSNYEISSGTHTINLQRSESEKLNNYYVGYLGSFSNNDYGDKQKTKAMINACLAIADCAKEYKAGYTVSLRGSYTWYRDGGQSDAEYRSSFRNAKLEGEKGIPKETLIGSVVNNGSNVVLDRLHFDSADNTYTQNSGSTTIGTIDGPGKVVINGGDVVVNGLLTISGATAANIGVRDLNSLAALNAISYAAGQKASFGGLTGVANSLQVGNATLKVAGDYTQNIRNQAANAIKNKFGSGVNVVFTGNLAVDNSLDLTNGWTSAVLNSVFNENNRANYLFHTLNWNAQNQNKVVGTGDIQKNFGVKNIDNAGALIVNNGATFAILGENSGTHLGGGIFTADNGTLIFGAQGLASGGWATDVNVINNGKLNINAGDFSIASLKISGNVQNKGTLRLADFSFGNNGRLNSSGTLSAQQDKLFTIEDSSIDGLNVVDLGQTIGQEVREELTELFRKYVPDNQKVLDEIVNHASFTGGKVIVTNAHLTQTQADDLRKAFNAKFGGATTLEFQGTIAGISQNDKLTVAKVNQLYDGEEGLRGVIYVDKKLEGENGSVVIGNSGVKNNTGFTGINEASSTTIQDGKELTLIGAKAGGTGTRFNLAEKVISAVGNGAKLILGTLGIKDSNLYQGQAVEVTLADGGELKVAAGDYQVVNHSSTGGTTTVDKGAVFRSDNATFTDSAIFRNQGETTIGTLAGWNKAEVLNDNKLTVTGTTQFGGRIINNANAKLVGTADIDGTLQNSAGANLIANTVHVNGTLRNFGYMEALDNSTVFGTLENPGEIRLFNTAIGSRGEGYIGTIGNTYSLKATGKTQVSGLIANAKGAIAEFTGEGSELNILSGGVVSNNGTLIADSLIVGEGGYFINGDNAQQTFAASPKRMKATARAVARATEQLRNLSVVAGGTKTNNGLGYYGTGSIAGEFINAAGAQAFGGVSDIYVDGAGLGITNTGSIKNAGTFTFGGHLRNAGEISGDGTVILAPAGLGDDTFINTGSITVGTLQADAIHYSQYKGTIASQNGWFSNSTVDLAGGRMEHAVLGENNVYELGIGTGSNDAATFTVGTLDSSSIVNINRGATLRTEHIAMDGHKTTNLVGGRLSTTLDQVFSDLDYKTLNLDAVNPDDKVDVTSNPQIVTGVGAVIDSVAEGIAFKWGTVAFDDASYSTALVGDAVNKLVAIGDVPADHRGELEVAFNGKAAEHFNVDLANSIQASNAEGTAYATFANETLFNESKDSPGATSLVVGSSDRSAIIVPTDGTPNVLEQNMGFMNVRGVSEGLYINSGKHFVLVGQVQPNPNLNPVELADGTVWIGGHINSDGVTTNSTLTLGSYGSASATKGHLKELNVGISPFGSQQGGASGRLIVKNGVFTVDELRNGAVGSSDLQGIVIGSDSDRTAELRVGKYTAVDIGTLLNDGVFHADSIESVNNANDIFNRHEFSAGTMDWTGRFVNSAKAEVDELTLRDSGNENKESGTMTIGNLTVSGDSKTGDSGTLPIRGELTNYALLGISEEAVIEGDLLNKGTLNAEKFAVKGAESEDNKGGNFINNAVAKIDSLITEAGTVVSNAADAVLTVVGLNNESELKGTLNNEGTLKVEGTQSVTLADGELNNTGKVENTNVFTVAGGLLVNTGAMILNGLDSLGGTIKNAADAIFTDSGTTKVELADAKDVGIKNEGHLELSNLMLLQGVIEGGSVGNKDKTVAQVAENGKLSTAQVAFKTLENKGTVQVSESFAVNSTSNSGVVEVDDTGVMTLAQGDVFTNNEGGTIKSEGLVDLSGTLVNRGTTDIAKLNINNGGVLTSQGTTDLNKVTAGEGAVINSESGSITVAELVANGATYNQTGGTFSADKGWFENSTLNIMGGVLNASNVKDADGNVTGLLGKNVVNISGNNTTPVIDKEDTVENKSHYKDKLTQVIAGTVNSDTTVNILSGGVLDVEKLDLNGKENTINLKGGVLQTSADQIFNSVTTEAVRLDATDVETGTVQLPTTVLSATTVGAVKDDIKVGLNVEEGNLALDDEYFSSSLIVSVTDKIANAFENAAKLTINFLGQMTAPFTITTANDLEKEGLDVVLNPGIVLNTTTLHNEFADEYNKDTDADQTIKGLVIGAASNDLDTNSINISMGFKDISHANNVTIEGGKELALVGNAVNAIPDASYGDDANKLLTDAADGGSINVNDGKFTFGTHGGASPTVGWINSSKLGEKGTLEAKNGEFADWTIKNDGNVHVHANAILHTNSLTGNGATVNEGKFSLDERDGVAPTLDVAGSFTNKGENSVLDASKVAETTVGGTLTNEGKADYQDMVIAEGGSSVNSGTEQGQNLTVNGSHANTGTSIWNETHIEESGKAENSGKFDVGTAFEIAGEFINKGIDAVIDATKTAVTNVAGLLRNEGTANYDDMVVAAGGKSENTGYEKGDILTVDGEHTNSGTSIWNNQTINEGASASTEEGAKETVNDTYVIAGDKVNKGEIDATGVENTEVSGNLDNQGKSTYDDMTISDGGKSDNSGFEQGDILTIADGGEHTNSGTSIWNNQKVEEGGSASNEEGGKETVKDEYVINGDKTNKGEVDATDVEDTKVNGNLDNQGKSEYDDMTIGDGGKSDNSGYEKGDILKIEEGGEHDNSGTSIWNNVVVAGGDVNNTGDIDTGKLTIDDGTVKIDGGSLKADETDLNGGDLVIGNDKDPSADNKVIAEINPKDDEIDTNIYVKNNGDLNLGPKGGLDWADSIGAPQIPDAPSRLVITTNVTTGPGGGIAVGPNVWTDKDNHVQLGNGDLYFADKSVTVIDAGILAEGKSAFNTTSDIAKVTVEPGANLILGNIEEVGDYTIVSGYKTEGNTTDGLSWIGGWTGDNLYALPQDGSGINWILTLHNDPSKIWVNAVLADVRTVYPDIAVPNIANDSMLNCKSGDAGADFVCRVLRDKDLDVAGKTKVINSVANIAFAGGAMSVAMNDLNSATDSMEGRVSMKGDAFTSDALMRNWDKGNNLWIDVLGGRQRYKSLSATGIDKAGNKTNSYGFIMGYDHKFENKPIILGGAFSYNHGSLDSTGDVLKTKNKYNSFGVHGYGAWSPSAKLNLVGTLSYMHNSSDITQSIGAAGFNKADADVKTNMFSVGARVESTLKVGKANVVPHAGVRYVWAKSGNYDTKVDGKKIWNNKADATNTFQIPVGVAVRADVPTANGWIVRPQADVAIIPQAGDTKQKTTVTNFNGVSDKLSGEFAGKFGTNVNLGVQADKGMATFGIRYGFTGGTKGKADHALKLEARYRF